MKRRNVPQLGAAALAWAARGDAPAAAASTHPFFPNAPPLAGGIPLILGNALDETRSLIGRGQPECFEHLW